MRSKSPKDKKAFLNSKHSVKEKMKMAYDKSLYEIFGLNDETRNQPFCRQKQFSFLKISSADVQGKAALKKGYSACTG